MYEEDIGMTLLNIQLKLLPNLLKIDRANANLPTIFEKVRCLSDAQRNFISEVLKLIKLILLVSATNIESERIFQHLKELKHIYDQLWVKSDLAV